MPPRKPPLRSPRLRVPLKKPVTCIIPTTSLTQKSPLNNILNGLLYKKRRLPTLPLFQAVPSALLGLTSLFGMGRGGSPTL